MKLAVDVVQEWRLAAWTQDLNYTKGVAPRTEAVLRQLEQARQALPEAVRPAHRGDVYHPPARVWAARWRKRWGGRHGRLRVREAIPSTTCGARYVPQALPARTKHGPKTGSVWRHQIASRWSENGPRTGSAWRHQIASRGSENGPRTGSAWRHPF